MFEIVEKELELWNKDWMLREIADAIIKMLTNRQRAFEMGQNGAKKIRVNFDINIIAEQHLCYYKGILG